MNVAISLDVSPLQYEGNDSAAFAEICLDTYMNYSLAGSELCLLWLREILSIQLCSWNTSPIVQDGTPALEQPTLLNQSLCICVGASNSALIVHDVECKWQNKLENL